MRERLGVERRGGHGRCDEVGGELDRNAGAFAVVFPQLPEERVLGLAGLKKGDCMRKNAVWMTGGISKTNPLIEVCVDDGDALAGVGLR